VINQSINQSINHRDKINRRWWAHNIFFMNRNKRIVQELASIIMPIVTPRLCTERVDSLRVHIQELRHTILRSW